MSAPAAAQESKFWCIQDLRKLELQRVEWKGEPAVRHFHDCFEIAVVNRGFQKLWCRGATHHVGPGSVIVLPPGETHQISTAHDLGCSVSVFYPDQKAMRDAASTASGRRLPDPEFSGRVFYDFKLSLSMRGLHGLLETSDSLLQMETHAVYVAGELVSRHGSVTGDASKKDVPPKAVKVAQDYLEGNFQRNISLTELSQVAGMARFGLARTFAKHFGIPPHAYLTQVRLLHAKRLLAEGMPLPDAASAAGFSDQSHLTRHFKRFLGITPGRYLKARTFKTVR